MPLLQIPRLLILTIFLIVFAALVTSSVSMPSAKKVLNNDPAAAEYGEYFQGDIMEPILRNFAGLINTHNHWPRGEVLYKFDSSLSLTIRVNALLAMSRVAQESGNDCISFREWNPLLGDTYVLIKSGSGCSATVGYWSGRVTSINLSELCSVGTIMHELQHTLGVEHQHSRPDRDGFVKINFENITPGSELNFLKESSRYYDSYGQAYDFGSQMHYSLTAFSKNGQATIEAQPGRLPEGVKVGQRERMSQGDIGLLRAMYSCGNSA